MLPYGKPWSCCCRVDEEEAVGDDINACTPLLKVNPETAREEYLLNGQEGLDDLLAALEGGFEVRANLHFVLRLLEISCHYE